MNQNRMLYKVFVSIIPQAQVLSYSDTPFDLPIVSWRCLSQPYQLASAPAGKTKSDF